LARQFDFTRFWFGICALLFACSVAVSANCKIRDRPGMGRGFYRRRDCNLYYFGDDMTASVPGGCYDPRAPRKPIHERLGEVRELFGISNREKAGVAPQNYPY
jgi:hypothetical protein